MSGRRSANQTVSTVHGSRLIYSSPIHVLWEAGRFQNRPRDAFHSRSDLALKEGYNST